MKSKNMKFEDALKFVKTKRSIIQPNVGFKDQLRAFETKLFEMSTNLHQSVTIPSGKDQQDTKKNQDNGSFLLADWR